MQNRHSPNIGGIRSAITQLVQEGAVVVELGDRIGLDRLEHLYHILTIYSDKTKMPFQISDKHVHVPTKSLADGVTEWYDPLLLGSLLPEKYDLLFVNGPKEKYGKFGLLENINLFNLDIPIIINDSIRENDAGIARELAYKLNRPVYVFWNFSIISPNLLSRHQVATIQREAIRVLENEEVDYLKDFFYSTTPIRTISRQEWHTFLLELKQDEQKYKQLKSSRSYKIGRLLTEPFRFMIKMFERK